MVYLSKDARHDQLLKAAVEVVRTEGLAAASVRRIAAATGAAVGQIHHHFASAAELRAQAFLTIFAEFRETWHQRVAHLPIDQQLNSTLVCDTAREDMDAQFAHLWNDAKMLSEKEEPIREACRSALELWQERIVELINAGRASGLFTPGDPADDIAWRLIGLSFGLDGLSEILPTRMTLDEQRRYIHSTIHRELHTPPRKE